MNRRVILVAGLLASACGDNLVVDPYDSATDTFIDTFCANPCTTGTEADCRADLAQDFADARAVLERDGLERCAHCLEIKAGLVAEVVDCDPTAAQDAEVFAACDLDPAEDLDKDGDPTNDHLEACAGFP